MSEASKFSYSTRDFKQIRSELMSRIREVGGDSWTDFNESDVGVAFIEGMAFVADLLSYYIDKQSLETILKYCRERKNMKHILELLDYSMGMAKSASGTLEIEFNTTHDLLVLDKYHQFNLVTKDKRKNKNLVTFSNISKSFFTESNKVKLIYRDVTSPWEGFEAYALLDKGTISSISVIKGGKGNLSNIEGVYLESGFGAILEPVFGSLSDGSNTIVSINVKDGGDDYTSTVNVTVHEGSCSVKSFGISSVLDNKLSVGVSNVSSGSVSVRLIGDSWVSGEWVPVDDVFFESIDKNDPSTAYIFSLSEDDDNKLIIQLKNGWESYVPTSVPNLKFEVSYVVTEGANGSVLYTKENSTVTSLSTLKDNNSVNIQSSVNQIINIDYISGGSDIEDMEVARVNAPKIARVMDTAVTDEDFDILCNSVAGCATAKCFTVNNNREIRRAYLIAQEQGLSQAEDLNFTIQPYKMVILAVNSDGVAIHPFADAGTYELIMQKIKKNKIAFADIEFKDVPFLDIEIRVDVVMKLGYTKPNSSDIINYIKKYFSPGEYLTFGTDVRLSVLSDYIQEFSSGIDYFNIYRKVNNSEVAFSDIVVPEMFFPRLKNIYVTVG